MSKCVCEGNWRIIVEEYEGLIGKRFKDRNGNIFTFFGLVWGEDDYYYGMHNKENGLQLLSCVGHIISFDYEIIPE